MGTIVVVIVVPARKSGRHVGGVGRARAASLGHWMDTTVGMRRMHAAGFVVAKVVHCWRSMSSFRFPISGLAVSAAILRDLKQYKWFSGPMT